MARRMRWCAALLLVCFVTGCATPQKKGDRAFERGHYQEALEHYEEAIGDGTRDWEVYYRAAQAATKGANFALAERYYSRALRYGGGADVARKFAEFYLKTSNYSRAVRLLQFLLEIEEEKQSLYNNLGTALMYAGAPLDAESYLRIAQQMEPKDPIPYVNLGVLYDRHLHKPHIALGFYHCYLELANDHGQRETVRSRVGELEAKMGDGAGMEMTCGEPYRPTRRSPGDVRTEMEKLGGEKTGGEADETGENKPIDLNFGSSRDKDSLGTFEGMESGEDSQQEKGASQGDSGSEDAPADAGPTIERPAERPRRQAVGGEDSGGEEGSEEDALRRAEMAWREDDFETVVEEISSLKVGELGIDAMRMYGRSLAELGQNEEASQWLGWAVQRKPDPETVGALLEVLERLEREAERERVCDRFRDRDGDGDATAGCPDPVEKIDKKTLEKLRKKKKQ